MMNCAHVRDQLPALLYGRLAPETATSMRDHLQACPACRREEAALQQVRRLLDEVCTPEVSVDLPRLYREAAAGQWRRTRRWRRAAVVLGAAAAAVAAFAVLPRWAVHIESHQVVLRWAERPSPAPGDPLPAEWHPESRLADPTREQVQVLSELVNGQREEFSRLQDRLEDLRRQLAAGTERWLTTERDVAALSSNQLASTKKGAVHE
jgi:anti-sigma factor (TIGR02949 family)